MGTHPINLALRFLLEMAALGAFGTYGWLRFEGPLRWAAALALPVVFMTLWGVFAVPEDPSRSGNAPVPTGGSVRLALELALFALAASALIHVNHARMGWLLGGAVIVHYAFSWDRIAWLLRQ